MAHSDGVPRRGEGNVHNENIFSIVAEQIWKKKERREERITGKDYFPRSNTETKATKMMLNQEEKIDLASSHSFLHKSNKIRRGLLPVFI